MPEPVITECDLCKKKLTKRMPWVGMNRWIVNCADGWQMVTAGVDDDYFWDAHSRAYSCRALCFPGCLMTWIEGEMVELKVKKKSG